MEEVSSNLTNSSCVHNVSYSIGLKISLGIFLISITIIGFLGNMLTCIIVYRKQPMRSAINLLLTNIAFTDIVLSVFTVPFIFYRLLRPDGDISHNVCITQSVVKDAMVTVMSYTLVVISADRFLIIVYKKDRLCATMAKTYTISIWCLALFFTLPQYFSRFRNTLIFDTIFCGWEKSFSVDIRVVYTLTLTSVTFYVPAIVMFYIHAFILRTVQLSLKTIHNHPGTAVTVSVTQYSNRLGLPPILAPYRVTGDFSAKRRAFGTILILYVTLFICWLPYIVKRTVDDFIGKSKSRDVTICIVLMTIGLSKGALYPVILCFRNKKFRTACLRIFPTQINFPTRCLKLKSRRISPKTVYEYSESETRI